MGWERRLGGKRLQWSIVYEQSAAFIHGLDFGNERKAEIDGNFEVSVMSP